MSASTIRLRVRYGETDQMGRAHHSHYLMWCEEGRTQWLRERGASYAELEARGILLPVSRVEVAYREPAAYEEEIEVVTGLEEIRSRSITFGYAVRRVSDGTLLAEASTELVCMDREGRVRRLPDSLRHMLEAASAAEEGGEA